MYRQTANSATQLLPLPHGWELLRILAISLRDDEAAGLRGVKNSSVGYDSSQALARVDRRTGGNELASGGKLVSTGPAVDSRECLGAVVSNGRIFYTSQASGFVVSQTYGPESKNLPPIWDQR